MKKISILFFSLVFIAGSTFAQAKKSAWTEMNELNQIMTSTFTPAAEGNLAPIKAKAQQLYLASKNLVSSEMPAAFDTKENKIAIEKFMVKCNDIWNAIATKNTDKNITMMIAEAKALYNKISPKK